MKPRRVGKRLRRLVLARAEGACEYCRTPVRFAVQSFSVEHITPLVKGGDDSLDNLALACQGCNGHKHAKTEARDPVSRREVPLFHPRRQSWNDHFVWSSEFALVIGRTPSGRATVEALRLNREGLVNLHFIL
ncbi:MAG: HNH endonuclease, partial [Thermoanaerobaculia bacterium]